MINITVKIQYTTYNFKRYQFEIYFGNPSIYKYYFGYLFFIAMYYCIFEVRYIGTGKSLSRGDDESNIFHFKPTFAWLQ